MHKDPNQNEKSRDNRKPRNSFIPLDVVFLVAEPSVVEKRDTAIALALRTPVRRDRVPEVAIWLITTRAVTSDRSVIGARAIVAAFFRTAAANRCGHGAWDR